jgi:L-ascorbate metabolism protein UlaG (beta-lactamase superfamily)
MRGSDQRSLDRFLTFSLHPRDTLAGEDPYVLFGDADVCFQSTPGPSVLKEEWTMIGAAIRLLSPLAVLLAVGSPDSFIRASGIGPAGLPRTTLEVTFVGNEGFLLVMEGRKVLVDALFDMPRAGGPSPDLLTRMEEGNPPFDNLDLILATHHHADHLQAESVLKALQHNPEATFLSTPQAIEELRASAADLGPLGERIVTLELPVGDSGEVTARGIGVRVLSSGHDGVPEVQNFMYLLSWAGLRIFHEGDAAVSPDTFQEWRFDPAGVDVAFFHYGLIVSPEWRGLLQETLRPRHLIPMHISPSQEREAGRRLETLGSELSGLHYLKEPMARVEITLKHLSF